MHIVALLGDFSKRCVCTYWRDSQGTLGFLLSCSRVGIVRGEKEKRGRKLGEGGNEKICGTLYELGTRIYRTKRTSQAIDFTDLIKQGAHRQEAVLSMPCVPQHIGGLGGTSFEKRDEGQIGALRN